MTPSSPGQQVEDPIEHVDLTEKTYELLRERILSGRMPVGERLQVTTLAEQLRVSHTPVKIALNRLNAEGIVRSVPRRGMFVARPRRKDVEEIQPVRLLIETAAIEIGVPRATLGDLAELRAELDRYAELVAAIPADGWNAYLGAQRNSAFHERIVALAGNGKLVEVWRGLQIQEQIARINALADSARPDKTLAEHRAILAAIEARDVQAAQAAVRAHIEESALALADAVDALDRLAQSDR